jgi:tetratricopeptide (TPR) repeat protein
MTRYVLGDLVGAEKYFIEGCAFFDDPGFQRRPTSGFIPAFGTGCWIAWTLGRTDLARSRENRMIEIADENGPYDTAHANYHAACFHVYTREYEEAEALAARSLELGEKLQFAQITAQSRCVLGHARAVLGNAREGIDLLQQGITEVIAVGSRSRLGYRIASLAAAQAYEGTIVEALETVERALGANPYELMSRPETIALRGELRRKQGHSQQAEEDFREAIALSQSMSAKAWELRAITSLARLLRDTDRRDEARTILADIYNWFTEGFDTADLIDAKALLDELS